MSEAQTRVFYTRSSNLICYSEKPKRINQDGQFIVIDGPRIEFSPQHDGFGRYVTSDPDEIAYLEKRAVEAGDILTPQDYNNATTPAEVRNKALERQITSQNTLIAELQAKLAKADGGQSRK